MPFVSGDATRPASYDKQGERWPGVNKEVRVYLSCTAPQDNSLWR